jgi:hypothetical protein
LRAELVKLTRDPLLLAVAAAVALSLLDAYVWIGALLSELAFPTALVALALALFYALKWQFARTALLFACALFFVRGSLPFLRSTRPTPEHGPTLRIVQLHAAEAPLSAAGVARFLAQTNADVASLTGLREQDRALAREHAGYVHIASAERGSKLLVKNALHVSPHLGPGTYVRLGRCNVEIVQVDLPSLFLPMALNERRRRIAQLAHASRQPRRIYVGHFGSDSSAADLAPLRENEEIRDARLGHGRLATVPDLLGPLGLPVDQILLHGWILARSVDSGPPLADGMHRTLMATLELTEPRCAPKWPARP